jgi:hypothetical protein
VDWAGTEGLDARGDTYSASFSFLLYNLAGNLL